MMLKAGVAVVDFFREGQNQTNVRSPTGFRTMTSTIARVEGEPFQEYFRLEGSMGVRHRRYLVEA